MALKIVGSSPIIHPIKNGHPKRVSIFYGIRRIMGLEEGGGSVAAVKNSPVDCFLARGRVPRRQANLCGKAAGLLNNPKSKSQTLFQNGKGLLFLTHQGCG